MMRLGVHVSVAKGLVGALTKATVACLHANDSKVEFGSGRDRHENIGEDFIGKESFRLLLHHREFSKLPFILETPGFDDKGPDKKNLDMLKKFTLLTKINLGCTYKDNCRL